MFDKVPRYERKKNLIWKNLKCILVDLVTLKIIHIKGAEPIVQLI